MLCLRSIVVELCDSALIADSANASANVDGSSFLAPGEKTAKVTGSYGLLATASVSLRSGTWLPRTRLAGRA